MFEKYFNILKSVKLFEGIETNDLESMLACLDAKMIRPHKNEWILMAGSRVEHVGIVLKGSLHITKENMDGNRALIAAVSPGDFFGEALCCAGVTQSPVSVVANLDSEVMLLAFQRILHTCPNSCPFHIKLFENMLQVIAAKNLQLQTRMDILSKKSVHAKVLAYLESVAQKKGRKFSIPFNREELADFLAIDRTSLSRELARLKEEGKLDYWKNQFTLY